MRTLVTIIIVFVFLSLVAMGILGVKSCSQLSKEVGDKGLKGVLEEIWEGKENK